MSDRLGTDFQAPGAYRGLAVGDFDNDGALEAALSRLNDTCVFFKRKEAPAGNWLLLDLRGRRSNRDGIGSRIRAVLSSGLTIFEYVTTANGIYSASDRRVHLGLGGAAAARLLEISWPSGVVQRIENVRANQILKVEEPSS
jgi:hypothetical protein